MTYYYDPEIIELKARAELPCKNTDVQQKAREYQDAVFNQLRSSFYLMANMEQINQDLLPFELTRIRKQLGRYGKGGKGYWWDWLHQNFPLVKIIKKGNSYQRGVTVVQIDIPLNIVLAGGDSKQIFESIYSKYDADSEVHTAPINTRSLKNYIASTAAENSINETIQKNLKDARLILAVAEHCDNQLPQIVNRSQFGRTYYQGLNLQTVHKTVRHAALGNCYSVDINTSVFNWKYSVVPFQQELSYTRELIKDKTRIRKTLAQIAFGTTDAWAVEIIKKTLTAISFGARGETGGSWYKDQYGNWTQGSISEIIRSKEIRTRLFADSWMKQFLKEQEQINKWIYDDLVAAIDQNLIPERYLTDLKTERGRISKNKLIAWAYQQNEQLVMKEIIAVNEKFSSAKPILQVHDGVYFDHKPDIKSMQTVLQEHWPLATLSYEEIDSYTYTNIVDIADHKKSIEAEERAANNGYMPPRQKIKQSASKTYDPHSEPDWEAEMQKEYNNLFENDYPAMIKDLLNR